MSVVALGSITMMRLRPVFVPGSCESSSITGDPWLKQWCRLRLAVAVVVVLAVVVVVVLIVARWRGYLL